MRMEIVLGILCVLLILYILYMQKQIKNINMQLEKRISQKTIQPVSLALINRELNILAGNVNRCLKEEENLRLEGERDEKKFREMISNISHDLRTPLTAVKGYLQLLEDSDLDQMQREKLMVARKHAGELGELIEHFFEYAYLVTEEPEICVERLNIRTLVTECLASSVPFFEEKNLTISLEAEEAVYVDADREKTVRIIQNLIRNCLQYAVGEVSVQLFYEEKAVLIFSNSVKDIHKIDPERIFERFYTADPSRNRSTGLGLSITKVLAEQMGGSVSAKVKGEKIEFRVEFGGQGACRKIVKASANLEG